MSSPILLLEFNELCPSLMERFIDQGRLPNFKCLRDQSDVFVTEAEEQAPYLEPWIQWVTVHSGIPYREHKIFNLGDGDKLAVRSIWDVISAAGLPVWVCGSMNVNYQQPINGYVLPDPWTTRVQPTPKDLMPYFRFVQQNVLEHTNDKVGLTKSEYIGFIKFMCTHGLKTITVVEILKQLAREQDGKNRWRRAFILDRLQFDLFASIYRKLKPQFSTFFLNSTAHMQHMYWRNMEPEKFKRQPTLQEQAEYSTAVVAAYEKMDDLVGCFLRLTSPDTVLVLVTGLSQQPCLIYEEQGGKLIYRPRNFEELLTFAGITEKHRVAPVMAEQFHVYFDSDGAAQTAVERLLALTVNGAPAMSVRRQGSDVFAGCAIFCELSPEISISAATSESRNFHDVFYNITGVKSGMHHRDGILWIRNGRGHRVHDDSKISLTTLAPTFLSLLGVPRPYHMSDRPLPLDPVVHRGVLSTLDAH